ncbi:hypothetical protein [Pluralibacter sp.]|uniref:hypothetical protein n=1 Tax=Pluralibacter sp. TaxID=1920032 RepID=UPI0025E55604|nr:hypothetical protein [Pluralibacter sp.]MBV8045071.1 hypothetical protein [Pluralibacter sp.]
MQRTKITLAIGLVILTLGPLTSLAATSNPHRTKAQEGCKELAFSPSSEDSIAITTFIARNGDAYRPVTKDDYQSLLFGLCMEEISAAERASSLDDLDLYLFTARSHWINILLSPAVKAEDIARDYYRALHNIPIKSQTKMKEEIPYPELRPNAIQDEKIAALEKYSRQKLLKGRTIENHCKSISSSMPNKEIPEDSLRKMAIRVCEGVMAINFTQGKHGISRGTAMDIAEKTYGKNSDEYRYFEQVTRLAFLESQ